MKLLLLTPFEQANFKTLIAIIELAKEAGYTHVIQYEDDIEPMNIEVYLDELDCMI